MSWLRDLAALGRMGAVAFRQAYGVIPPWMYVLTMFVRPATQVLFFGLLARFATGRPDVSYQLVGNAIHACGMSSLYAVADTLVEERGNGTLGLVTLAPRNRFLVFGSRLLAVGLHGLVIAVAALAVGAWTFGADLGRTDWGALAAALLVAVLATSCLGAALGSLALLLREMNLVSNLVSGGLLVLAGVNFPVAALPAWLQPVAYALPITRGAAAARLALAGGGPEIPGLLLGEALTGAGWLLAARLLYGWAEHRARRLGTLDLY